MTSFTSKLYLIFASTIILCFSGMASSIANENVCSTLFKQQKYDEALQACIEANEAFKVGYIYGKQDNCDKSHEWYLIDNSSISHLNMAIHKIFGSRGCSKDLSSAKENLQISLKKYEDIGNLYFMGRLIDIEDGNDSSWDTPSKEAFKYYLSSFNNS